MSFLKGIGQNYLANPGIDYNNSVESANSNFSEEK